MRKLSEKKASSTHRVIVFGGPKTGKSLIAGMLAEFYNIIWVDLENGHEVLFQLPEEWQERITLIDLKDTRDFPIASETCLKMVKKAVSICDEHGKVGCMICSKKEKESEEENAHELFFTDVDLPNLDNNSLVVFDSLTQLTNSCIAHITKNMPDDYKLDFDDWGNLGKLLDIFLSHIQQAKYNVVVISHETEAQTEGKKRTLVPVGGTRNFSRNVAKYFDHVVYAERKNNKHVFSCASTGSTTILTGSRTGARVEDYDGEDASLLPIFKPELYPKPMTIVRAHVDKYGKPIAVAPKNRSTTKQTTTEIKGGDKANDVLARLKKNIGK